MRTRLATAALIGASAIALVGCSSSNKSLIPAVNASPLESDFEAVSQAASSGNGKCGETAEAIRRTQRDFEALPASVASGLRNTLSTGIENLNRRALQLCAQVSTTTTTSTTSTTTSTTSTTTTTTTTETTTDSTPTSTSPGGGTPVTGETTTTTSAGEAPTGGAGVVAPE